MLKNLLIILAISFLSNNNHSPSYFFKKTPVEKIMTSEFKPPEWTHNANIYEVNVRQYTKEGTFNAFSKELSRLKNMGVKLLWFMPVTPISQINRKGNLGSYYACSDYTSVNPEFGTLNNFKHLVKEAHTLGFKVIIDWVANHTGWDHKWTKEHPDFFKKDPASGNFKTPSGMDDIIELDYHNPEMVKAMINAMKFWVKECDIDGFRCDLAFWVELPFWKKARKETDAIKPLFWLGELDPIEHPEYMGTFDAAYTWTWMHKAEEFYKKNLTVSSLDTVLKKYDLIGDQSMRTWFTSNHDENSWNGTEYEKYGDMALPLAVFSCTWNGIPMLYSGQELPNMERLKFFDKDEIKWTGRNKLHDFYKTLLNLHSTNPALRAADPNSETHLLKTGNDDHVLAYLRKNGNHGVLVILNLSAKNLHIKIHDEKIKGKFKNVFSGKENHFSDQENFELNAWQYLVFES